MISTPRAATDPHREVIAQWLDGSQRKRWKPWRRRKHLRRTFSEQVAAAVESIGDPLLAQSVHRLWEHPYFAFEPREDQPGIDEQTGFMDADSFISVILGGNGCLAPWQKVFDPVAGVERTISEIRGKWHVRAIDPATGRRVITEADEPWIKGRAPLYRWFLSDGSFFDATADHKVATERGWRTCLEAWRGMDPIPCSFYIPLDAERGTSELKEADAKARVSQLIEDAAVPIIWIRGRHEHPGGPKEFYDVGVPGFGNYELAGAIHANSGKTYVGAQRVAQFLEINPAPARDAPFWVIGPTYEISCGSCWAQKLCDILPEEWIDWGRITWINSKKNWPDVVPLLDPDGHGMRSTKRRNWSLQFKSYEQGRELMQAKAIGGAWFTEQFPQQVFDEVLRGLREYAGKVSAPVWMEFTPIDPARALFMEKKFEEWEQGELPDWSFWKFHTTAAMEAGHVDEGWHRTFFSGVSEEMLETRQAGSFASYEGTIYKTFRRGVHTVTKLAIPPGVQHRRSVDWGEGEHNALVMLWAYRDSLGTWYIYDEYYSTDQTMLYREHCAAMRSKREYDWEHHPVIYGATYAPPDRPGMFREFAANGIPCTTAKTSVLDGIEAVRAALKIRPLTGEPGLIIDETRCPNLVREMRTYRWIQPTENSKNPRDPKPEPLKFNDHAVDALRYLIYSEHSRIQAAIPKAMNALPDRRAGMPSKKVR